MFRVIYQSSLPDPFLTSFLTKTIAVKKDRLVGEDLQLGGVIKVPLLVLHSITNLRSGCGCYTDPICEEINNGYVCTQPKGHRGGFHIACSDIACGYHVWEA